MNRFFTLLFAASCLTAVGQVADYVPIDGLVSWYSLDGDVSQFSFNSSQGGTSGIAPTQNRFSQPQSAVEIGGGDFCLFHDVGSLDAIGEWTFSIWIRPSSGIQSIDYPHIWRFYDPDSYASIVTHLMGPAYANEIEGQIELYMTDSDGVQNPSGSHLWEATPSLDVWSHVVARRENGEISVFLNSVLTASYESSDYGLDSLILTGLTLGGNADYPVANRIWLGGLDDAGVWGRALSEAEIFSLFNAPGPLEGCIDESACNFDQEAVLDDGSCLYFDNCGECGGSSIAGCLDDQACNFNAEAACDDGSCDYTCCPGPGCCSQGLFWDWELGQCFPTNPADINLDGCVQLNDLLDLLSAYGDCGAEESPWQCGDPLEYQGYDYETVQIGEQCWFAENLRAEYYRNGDAIPGGLSNDAWSSTMSGARAVYADGGNPGGQGAECVSIFTSLDVCVGDIALGVYGRLYNWYAVTDARHLCPLNWQVPDLENWSQLEEYVGSDSAGVHLKSISDWYEFGPNWNLETISGEDTYGFRALPSGGRGSSGTTYDAGNATSFWTSTFNDNGSNSAFRKALASASAQLNGGSELLNVGNAVRCIKN